MQFRWRTIGTISTFLVLIITSVFLLSQWLQHAL
jgi:uncharacterized membrane protein YecN with MAPEG domain